MRTHSNDFKNEIKQYGRQFSDNIYYDNNTYNGEHINSVNYSVDTTLLKSVMQTIKIDTDILLEVNNTLDYGISLSGTNDEIRFNNFIVNKVEEQKDKKSYLVTCYDNMIKTMVDYETPKVNGTTITFPITIREYINAICNHLGLTFKDAASTFTNYNVSIPKDYYLDEGGNNLGYTFRDVLDDIAECIGCWLCCDSNGQIEVRNITTTNDTINEDYFKDRNVNVGKKYGPINSVVFSRIGEDNIYRKDDESIEEDGLCEVKITDNQLLSDENRDNFIQGVYDNLHGLEFYLNDFQLTGVLYYEVGDMFNASIDNNLYQCLLLSDSFKRTTGLSETIITTEPKITETPYKKADTNDRKINQTMLVVDKQEGTITGLVSKTDTIEMTANEASSVANQASNTAIEANTKANSVDEDLQEYKQTIATQFTQTNEDFTFQFNNITDLVNQVSDTESGHYSELHKYIRFINGVIVLGEEGSPFTVELSNVRLSFKENGTEVAYVSNNKLNITNADIKTQLDLGNFQFKPRDNGSLSFGKKS